MSLETQTLAVIDAFNRRDFDALLAPFEKEAVLDLPDGIRVIGKAAFRDTLAAYVLRHDLRLADQVIMTDGAGFRVAAECTLNGRDRRHVDTDQKEDIVSYALPAVLILEREADLFSRLSLYAGTRP